MAEYQPLTSHADPDSSQLEEGDFSYSTPQTSSSSIFDKRRLFVDEWISRASAPILRYSPLACLAFIIYFALPTPAVKAIAHYHKSAWNTASVHLGLPTPFDTQDDLVFDAAEKCRRTDDFTIGSWSPRVPAFTRPEQLGFIHQGEGYFNTWACSAIVNEYPDMPVYQDRSLAAIDAERRTGAGRTVSTGNWLWTSEVCPVAETNLSKWIMYLLSMPRGAFFMGDSVTGQQAIGLVTQFGVQEGKNALILRTPTSQWGTGREVYVVNKKHAVIRRIRASLTKEQDELFLKRLQYPVIQFYWESHLVHHSDAGKWIEATGGSNSTGWEVESGPYASLPHKPWLKDLEEALVAYDTPEAMWTRPQRTLAVMNSGPHWSTRYLLGLNEEDPEGNILEAYKMMVTNVTQSVHGLPKSEERLRPIYRTINPVTAECGKYREPFESLERQELYPKLYNYHMFRDMDQQWIGRDFEILNVTYMTGLRPDARKRPEKGDCLHTCLPVTFAWNQVIFSTVS